DGPHPGYARRARARTGRRRESRSTLRAALPPATRVHGRRYPPRRPHALRSCPVAAPCPWRHHRASYGLRSFALGRSPSPPGRYPERMAGIGSLNESPLHAALKHHVAPPGSRFEVLVDGYVVDVVADGMLLEVQT